MFDPPQPTDDGKWKSEAKTPTAMDKTEVDVQMGHRRVVIRQRMASSIFVAQTVVLPLALLKNIACTVLMAEAAAEHAHAQRGNIVPAPAGSIPPMPNGG